ncbi:hypothetical protein A253_27849 [Pseudomonas syringae pv. actinidiae ICMP 19102]|nr:hypothetical protein A253_27849 [Pseudomonas syringae pv. actinidiae ICMP 19102]
MTDAEFKFVLELVDSDRAGMAQNLAGPKVDVPALVAGRSLNWRALADDWAEACGSRGNVTLDTGKDAFPLEASAAGTERALADREQVMLQRSQAAKPAPYLGSVFPDKLRALV